MMTKKAEPCPDCMKLSGKKKPPICDKCKDKYRNSDTLNSRIFEGKIGIADRAQIGCKGEKKMGRKARLPNNPKGETMNRLLLDKSASDVVRRNGGCDAGHLTGLIHDPFHRSDDRGAG